MKKNNTRTISILSLQHMLVDFICAAVMYHKILNGQGNQAVIYNMCAFALQMPLGLMADLSRTRIRNISALFVCGSVPFLAAGCMGSCILLGIGNALFHVGGGIITINADNKNRFEGRGLGCFVAPGAIGLVCGKLLSNYVIQITIGALIILAVLCTVLLREKNEDSETSVSKIEINPDLLITVICCFLVVVFRSYVGLKMSFAWRKSALLIFISVVVLAAGKTLGGFAAPVFGMRKTIIVSLVGAAICFMLKDMLPFGMAALLLFNMSMPLTLYLLANRMPTTPGLAFGILTFALFIGYLPSAYGVTFSNMALVGTILSLFSALVLTVACRNEDK